MKNQMELLQAAQKAAAETLNVVDPLDLHNAKSTLFSALNICKSHFPQFTQFFDSARAAYQSLIQQPVTIAPPTTPQSAS